MRGKKIKHNAKTALRSARSANPAALTIIKELQSNQLTDSTAIRSYFMKGADAWNKYLSEQRAKDPDFSPVVAELATVGYNLEGYNLKGVKFLDVDFTGASFHGTVIIDATFERADLTEAMFGGSALNNTQFTDCKMIGANFFEAELNSCQIIKCQARELNFEQAKLSENKFEDSDLSDTDFTKVDLQEGSFINCDLTRSYGNQASFCGQMKSKVLFKECALASASFKNGEFSDCDFEDISCNWMTVRRSKLNHCNFKNADLGAVNFSATRLHDVCFDGAKLKNTTFQDAEITRTSFQGAKIDSDTTNFWAVRNIKSSDFTGADIGRNAGKAFEQHQILERAQEA